MRISLLPFTTREPMLDTSEPTSLTFMAPAHHMGRQSCVSATIMPLASALSCRPRWVATGPSGNRLPPEPLRNYAVGDAVDTLVDNLYWEGVVAAVSSGPPATVTVFGTCALAAPPPAFSPQFSQHFPCAVPTELLHAAVFAPSPPQIPFSLPGGGFRCARQAEPPPPSLSSLSLAKKNWPHQFGGLQD